MRMCTTDGMFASSMRHLLSACSANRTPMQPKLMQAHTSPTISIVIVISHLPWAQVEPISACTLELSKMASYRQLTYAPSRNRQWHLFTATERPDAKR